MDKAGNILSKDKNSSLSLLDKLGQSKVIS